MSSNEPIQRVRIYLNERDMSEGQPLYLATLDRLQREGATGATVLRGIAGFGAGRRLRVTSAADLNSAPVVVEWVDRAERVGRVLPTLDDLLPEALITIEDLRVYRAVLRAGGPFGERTIGEVMAREVAAAGTQMLVRDAAELMFERDQPLLPICDERGSLVGVLTSGDLLRRAELALPLRLFGALTADERRAVLDRLPARTVADAMTADPRTVYVESAIAPALSPMVEWGLETLPVLDRAGQLAGFFGVAQALQAALRDRDADDQAVRDAEPPTLVSLVMQRAVPSIAAATPLPDVLARLLAVPERFLVVLDAGRPIGMLTDLHLARQLAEPARSAWLAALRSTATPLPTTLEPAIADPSSVESQPTAGSLADLTVPTIDARATQDAAIQAMLEGGYERLVVIDADGRLVGLLARGGLLRALAQVSAG